MVAHAWREGANNGYDPDRPWNAAMRHLILDQVWWNEHVILPCNLVAAHAAAHTKIVWDDGVPAGGTQAVGIPAISTESHAGAGRPPSRASDDHSRKDSNGHYTHNRKGVELCIGFGKATCMKKDKLNKCGSNSSRTHQCAICLQVHPTCEHDKHANAAKKGGKGAGRQRNPKAWWKQ